MARDDAGQRSNRIVAEMPAWIGIALLTIAGLASPFYVRADRVAIAAVILLGFAVVLAAIVVVSRRRAPSEPAPTLATVSARAPLEVAPDELRRQLDTLRHTQAELLVAKQAAEAAMMAKGEFLATMSHEIRTPLNGVLPLLELVLSSPLAADQRDYLATAHASARELLRIVDAILDYSKLDAERLELETTGLNIRDIVNGVAQLMQRNAEAKNLKLTVVIEPNVRLAVRGDPVRLRQVLTNLVSNAIKFTERGGVQIHVSKRGETRDHHDMVFAVRDSGIGLAHDTAAKLFRPFSQADASTTRVFGGTGLGLAICKRLVDLMQGQIGVKSELGRGSLFWFSVPLLKAVGDLQVRRSLDGIRAVALVDDDVQLRRLHSAASTLGIEIVPARTQADALAALRATANMGERWRQSLLVIDGAAFRSAGATLVRNVLKDAALGHVQIVLVGATGADIPADSRLRILTAGIGDESLRVVLTPLFGVEESPSARIDIAPVVELPVADVVGNARLAGRVLLVEDNVVNRKVAERLLGLFGLDVTPVGDGREAIERLGRDAFDVVLMDCLMPVMDGYTATRRWREHENTLGDATHLPILAMTANAMAGDREKCLAAGMDDYISKPLDRGALVALLKRWLPNSGEATAGNPARGGAAANDSARHAVRSDDSAPTAGNVAPFAGELTSPPPAAPRNPLTTIGSTATSFANADALDSPRERANDAEIDAMLAAIGAEPSATAASAPHAESAAIDATIIGDLLDTMGDEFGDLVRVYLEDAPQRLRELEIAADAGDAHAQIAPAHTLKSSSANIGATRLSEFARTIEHASRSGVLTAPVEIAGGIRREYGRVAAELTALLVRGTS